MVYLSTEGYCDGKYRFIRLYCSFLPSLFQQPYIYIVYTPREEKQMELPRSREKNKGTLEDASEKCISGTQGFTWLSFGYRFFFILHI